MTRADKILALSVIVDTGCAPYYDMMPRLIKERGYRKGIEIGVLFGGHAKAMLGNDCMRLLIGIDPYRIYEQEVVGIGDQSDFESVYAFAMERLTSDRYLHIRMTSDEAYQLLSADTRMFDFVFIDGLHTYEQIKKDLDHYGDLVRKGGVIACHDYNHPDFPLLTVAIDQYASEHNTEVILGNFHAVYMDKTW